MTEFTKSIGWDIGIKNLAFCIVVPKNVSTSETITLNSHHYAIEHWKDISLVSEIENNLNTNGEASILNIELKCSSEKSDKIGESALCGITAHYCLVTKSADGSYQGRCKKHFKKEGHTRLPEIAVKKCYSENCTGKCVQVLRNHIFIGYCKKHISELIKAGVHTTLDFFKINKANKTATINLNHLGTALFKELDKNRTIMLSPDNILLENQPVLKNPTMKSMQMFLYSYYLLRGMDAKDARRGTGGDGTGGGGTGGSDVTIPDKHIQCYCAGKKLDLIKFFPKEEQIRITALVQKVKSGYQQNKQMSIHLVENLLCGNTKWSTFFSNHKKRDDLADSLLMTLHYLEKANLVKLVKQLKKDSGVKGVKGVKGMNQVSSEIVSDSESLNLDE